MARGQRLGNSTRGIFSCCKNNYRGCSNAAPISDPNELVVDAKEHFSALPCLGDGGLIPSNEIREIQPAKEFVNDEIKETREWKESAVTEIQILTIDTNDRITFRPRCDTMFDPSKKELVIIISLPGFVKEELDIEIEKGTLTISGECRKATPAERYGEGIQFYVRDVQYGYFNRSFQLPPNVLEESIEAHMHDGNLEVHLRCITSGDKRKVIVA